MAPDVCGVPAEPIFELVNAQFQIRDDNSSGQLQLLSRIQDSDNYYLLTYDVGGASLELQKGVANVISGLDSDGPLPANPAVDSVVTLSLSCEGDSLIGLAQTDEGDLTVTATDSTFGENTVRGVALLGHRCSYWKAEDDGVLIMEDTWSEAGDPDVSAHTMDLGSGWSYAESQYVYAVDSASGTMNMTSIASPTVVCYFVHASP